MRLRLSDVHSTGYEVDSPEIDGLTGVLGLGRFHAALVARRSPTDVCNVCGWTRGQYESTGLLGCGACYETLLGAPTSAGS